MSDTHVSNCTFVQLGIQLSPNLMPANGRHRPFTELQEAKLMIFTSTLFFLPNPPHTHMGAISRILATRFMATSITDNY